MTIVEYELGEFRLRVLPEAYTVHSSFLAKKGFISIGGISTGKQEVVMVDGQGKVLDRRAKVVLTNREIDIGYELGSKEDFRSFRLGRYFILPIICYEILSPEIWKRVKGKINLVTHHIGYPLYDRAQANRWRSLQRELSEHFDCPVVCSVGNAKNKDGIDISGVVFKDFDIPEYGAFIKLKSKPSTNLEDDTNE